MHEVDEETDDVSNEDSKNSSSEESEVESNVDETDKPVSNGLAPIYKMSELTLNLLDID